MESAVSILSLIECLTPWTQYSNCMSNGLACMYMCTCSDESDILLESGPVLSPLREDIGSVCVFSLRAAMECVAKLDIPPPRIGEDPGDTDACGQCIWPFKHVQDTCMCKFIRYMTVQS